MRRKLYLLVLGVCLLTTILSSTLISIAVGVLQEDMITRHLTDMAAVMWESGAGSLDEAALLQMADKWVQRVNADGNIYRLTVLTRDGTVLLDTDQNADPNKMENHASRPEVVEALQTGVGEDVRRSATLQQDYLYVAMAEAPVDRVIRISMPLSEVAHTKNVVVVWAGLSGFAALLIAAVICLPISKRFIHPIDRLRAATQRISQGDYSLMVEKSNDEIGLLGQDFQRMAGHLKSTMDSERARKAQLDSILNAVPLGIMAVDAQEKVLFANQPAQMLLDMAGESNGKSMMSVLRNAQIWQMVRDTLGDGQSAEQDLKGRRILHITVAPILQEQGQPPGGAAVVVQDLTELRRLENLRSEFASNVSHEMKTPLTSIRGYIETLRSGVAQDEKLRSEILDILEIQSERLGNLIEDLLSLAEIENASRTDAAAETCDMSSIINEAVQMVKPQADALNITVTQETQPRLLIAGRPERMRRLLVNLVDNAVKYNHPGGWVKVKGYHQAGRITITVQDNGIGIPREHWGRIFERFYRVDKGRSRQMGGTGLGLSIVKHLVELYDGDITFTSREGEGTCFTVSFPVKET